MGHDSQKKLGLNRGVDTTRTVPLRIFIVGLDGIGETEEERIAWLKGHFPKQSVRIDALRDARACAEVPDSFVGLCRSGIRNPVSVENMNGAFSADAEAGWAGLPLLCVVAGRQRTKALRMVNNERVAEGKPALEILLIQRKYSDALGAREDKAIENVRVESTPSQRAWLANDLHSAGMSLADVAPRVGVTSEQAVKNLLALLECSASVLAACDAGHITQTVAMGLSKESDHAKQDERLTKLLAAAEGKTGREKSKALRGESTKAKPVSGKKLGKVSEMLTQLDRSEMNDPCRVDEWISIVRWALGDPDAYDALPDEVRGAIIASEKKPGKSKSKSNETDESEETGTTFLGQLDECSDQEEAA